MPFAGFSIGLFLSFRKVLVLITFISAAVSILKIIIISPTFNFTCQGFFFWKFILAYRHKEISLRRMFPYFGNILYLRLTTYCEVIPFITVSAIFSFCWTVIKFVIFVAHFTSRRIRCLLWIFFPSWVFCGYFPFPCYRIHWVVLHFLHLHFDLFVATSYFDDLFQTKVFSKLELFR